VEPSGLKNFGKPLTDMTSDRTDAQQKELRQTSLKLFKKHLGLFNMIRLMFLSAKESRRLSEKNLASVYNKGLTNAVFIESQIGFAAMFSAMSKLVGIDKTLEIFYELMEEIVPKTILEWAPTSVDFKQFDDPFAVFKDWLLAMFDANQQAGVHVIELVENNDDAFQINCVYCAWHEIAKQLGIEEACLPSCYTDDIYLPKMCQSLGIRYERTTTLARGGDICDFRFVRQ